MGFHGNLGAVCQHLIQEHPEGRQGAGAQGNLHRCTEIMIVCHFLMTGYLEGTLETSLPLFVQGNYTRSQEEPQQMGVGVGASDFNVSFLCIVPDCILDPSSPHS